MCWFNCSCEMWLLKNSKFQLLFNNTTVDAWINNPMLYVKLLINVIISALAFADRFKMFSFWWVAMIRRGLMENMICVTIGPEVLLNYRGGSESEKTNHGIWGDAVELAITRFPIKRNSLQGSLVALWLLNGIRLIFWRSIMNVRGVRFESPFMT